MPRHMVYNCRDRYDPRTGGAPLTGTGTRPDDSAGDERQVRTLQVFFTLALALAAMLVLAGCGAGGSGSESSGGGDDDARASGSSDPGNSGGETARLGTPSLGSADAPVVLTEYSDYQ